MAKTAPPIYKAKDAPKKINLLLYGPTGAGKTTLASSGSGKTLFLNVEQGITSLSADTGDEELNQRLRDVDVWDILKFDDIWDAYEFLTEQEHDYETVIIDSYTDLTSKCLEEVVTEAESVSTKPRLTDSAELNDRGRVTLKMSKVLRRYRDLPQNVVLICLDLDPNDKSPTTRPNLPPGLMLQAISYFDIVGYLFLAQDSEDPDVEHRKLLLHSPSGAVKVRDRHGAFNSARPGLVDPTLDTLEEALFGSVGSHSVTARPKARKTKKQATSEETE